MTRLKLSTAILILTFASAAFAAPRKPIQVFILAGQSNMEGQAEVATKNKTTGKYLNGTLAYQLTDPRTAEVRAGFVFPAVFSSLRWWCSQLVLALRESA